MNRLTTCFLHVEPNQMICTADQLTGFLGAIVVKGLIKIMFLIMFFLSFKDHVLP